MMTSKDILFLVWEPYFDQLEKDMGLASDPLTIAKLKAIDDLISVAGKLYNEIEGDIPEGEHTWTTRKKLLVDALERIDKLEAEKEVST